MGGGGWGATRERCATTRRTILARLRRRRARSGLHGPQLSRLGAVLAVGALLLGGAGLAPTQASADTPADTDPYRDGSWSGSISASGPVFASFPEASVLMSTAMSGSTTFVVHQGEILTGAWSINGTSGGTITSASMGDGTISNVYGGGGPVDGDTSRLELGGTVSTTWTTVIGGQASSEQDPIQLGPFEVEVIHVDCNRVFGLWQDSFAAEIEEAGGWDSALVGTFEASYVGDDPDGGLADRMQDLIDDAQGFLAEVAAGSFDGVEGGITVDAALEQRIHDLLVRSIDLEAELADLGPGEGCAFAGGADAFSTMITGIMQEAAWVLLDSGQLDPWGIELFARTLLTYGGIGSGAVHTERVADLEGIFARRISEVLEEVVITDAVAADGSGCTPATPCFPHDPDVIHALRAAQMLGVTVTIAGQDLDASQVSDWLTWLDDGSGQ